MTEVKKHIETIQHTEDLEGIFLTRKIHFKCVLRQGQPERSAALFSSLLALSQIVLGKHLHFARVE